MVLIQAIKKKLLLIYILKNSISNRHLYYGLNEKYKK